MALTANTVYEILGVSTRIPGVAKDANPSEVYFRGAILAIGSDGKLTKPTGDVADQIPAGIYTGYGMGEPYTSLTVLNGQAPTVERIVGRVWVPFTGAALADVGKLFYLVDDNTLTKTKGTNRNWALLCEEQKPGYVLVNFGHPIPV
jgi:hypothetical protein